MGAKGLEMVVESNIKTIEQFVILLKYSSNEISDSIAELGAAIAQLKTMEFEGKIADIMIPYLKALEQFLAGLKENHDQIYHQTNKKLETNYGMSIYASSTAGSIAEARNKAVQKHLQKGR